MNISTGSKRPKLAQSYDTAIKKSFSGSKAFVKRFHQLKRRLFRLTSLHCSFLFLAKAANDVCFSERVTLHEERAAINK